MTNQDINITLIKRETVGKGLNKLRTDGQIPAVIHNEGKESIVVEGQYNELHKIFSQAGKHHPVNVKVGEKEYLTIIKDVHINPKTHRLHHLVFGTIRQDQKVETEVGIVFEGDAPAQKAGLLVIRQLDHIQLEALPRDLPNELKVSIESLENIGDRITVADISVPKGVTILTELERPIASVEETPVQVPEETEEADGEEGEASEGEGEATEDAESKEQ